MKQSTGRRQKKSPAEAGQGIIMRRPNTRLPGWFRVIFWTRAAGLGLTEIVFCPFALLPHRRPSNGNPAGWRGDCGGAPQPPRVCTCVSRNGSGAASVTRTPAGVPGKEKPRHTHPPCSLWRGFSGGLITWEIAQKGSSHPVVSLPLERATAVVLGYRVTDLLKVLRLRHTRKSPDQGSPGGCPRFC
jgi:hypothetical protein